MIEGAHHAHRSGDFGQPYQRPRPPDFLCDFDYSVRAAKVRAVAVQKTHFAKKLLRRQTQ